MDFTTELDSIYILGAENFDSGWARINWTVDIEVRSWGLKSIISYYRDISIRWYDEDDNEHEFTEIGS